MINEKHARRFCCEDISKIEGYQEAVADKDEIWETHHRLEIQGQFVNSVKLLKRCHMYYKRPASELIFLKHDVHRSLHHSGQKHYLFGKHLAAKTRKKLSQANLGKHHSEASREKISQAMSGEKHPLFGKHHSEVTRKKLSAALSGEKNPNFGKCLSVEYKKKISLAMSGEKNPAFGFHWWNNGMESILARECPPGFVKGRLYRRRAAQERGEELTKTEMSPIHPGRAWMD